MANEKKMDYVILGLLSHESLTGYEIKKRVDSSLSFFWGASYGSIYPTLNALMKNKLATRQELNENGRDKSIYTITECGRDHLRNWLCLPVEKNEFRMEILLKLFFGSEAGTNTTISHIHSYKEEMSNKLQQLNKILNELDGIQDTDDAHIYYRLTTMLGAKMFEACMGWCSDAVNILEQQKHSVLAGNRKKTE